MSGRRAAMIAGALTLLIALAGLLYYKWTGSIATMESVRAVGAWSQSADAITTGGVLKATLHYFGKVWIALLFGLLIGAAVRAAISPQLVISFLSKGGAAKRQAAGGLAGAPLMLCSCCITPVFTGVYERGARLGSALSVMLASPGLNLAALVLTFALFPLDMSLARLGAALVAVFALPWALERAFGGTLKPVEPPKDGGEGPQTLCEFLVRFVKSLIYLAAVTIPLITAGVFLSSLVLPYGLSSTQGGVVAALLAVSAISVLVALPTFFEIPLALLLIQMGAPGAATAMLFAGPIVNLPSLLVVGRETNWKVSGALAVGIWLLAVGAGVAVIL